MKSNLKKLINLSEQATLEILKKFGIEEISILEIRDQVEWYHVKHKDIEDFESIEWQENNKVNSYLIDPGPLEHDDYILFKVLYGPNNYILFNKSNQIKNLY
mgnify:FL=1